MSAVAQDNVAQDNIVQSATAEPLLKISNVEVIYDHVILVLKGVSLSVPKGGIVALLGSNGAGKSTLNNTISGLQAPFGGTIRFDGNDIGGAPSTRIVEAGLVQVPEGRRVFPNLSVRENLEMGAYTVRDSAAAAKRMAQAVELFPRLGERMSQLGGTLSGGEQQMLAIARALMSGPKLLMLDEPSLGIAPVLVDQIFQAIARIREEGTTVLLVEQNTRRALAAAQRAYVLVTGEVALTGSAQELADDPRVKGAYLGDKAHG